MSHDHSAAAEQGGRPAGGEHGLHRLRGLLVDSPTSVAAKARARRWDVFLAQFPGFRDMTVLDLGGTVEAWRRAPVRPEQVFVVNLDARADAELDGVEFVQGDACALPAAVSGRQFDLVFSNAVLEHVGGHLHRLRFAETVRSSAPRYWVQTPYRYFPVEPHWLFPGFQFLPLAARVEVSRRWPLVHTPSNRKEDALSAALGVELVSRTEMEYCFPDSHIVSEKLLGLPKSLIAIRGGSGSTCAGRP